MAHPLLPACRKKELAALLEREVNAGATATAAASDEDAARSAWLLQVESAALAAIDDVAMIDGEVALLRHASSLPASSGALSAAPQERRRTEKAGEVLQGLRGVIHGLRHGAQEREPTVFGS